MTKSTVSEGSSNVSVEITALGLTADQAHARALATVDALAAMWADVDFARRTGAGGFDVAPLSSYDIEETGPMTLRCAT